MRGQFIDLAGQHFGQLTVIRYAGQDGRCESLWLCKCTCGNERTMLSSNIRKQNTSCGCQKKVSAETSLLGMTFGYWTVLSFNENKNGRSIYWLCRCVCGTEKSVEGKTLKSGRSRSCGCHQYEKHTTHGRTTDKSSRRYLTWRSFRNAYERCTKPWTDSYENYGGRGIEFRLKSIDELVEAIGERPSRWHSIDRIDVNGHYEIGNVRWATWREQANNRRNSKQEKITDP